MRLLSFITQVETTLAMLQPDHVSGWSRRADYQTGSAVWWNPSFGLSLHLNASTLGDDRHSIKAAWCGAGGAVLNERTHFCGASPFDWQAAADAVAEAMPDVSSLPAAPDLTEAATA